MFYIIAPRAHVALRRDWARNKQSRTCVNVSCTKQTAAASGLVIQDRPYADRATTPLICRGFLTGSRLLVHARSRRCLLLLLALVLASPIRTPLRLQRDSFAPWPLQPRRTRLPRGGVTVMREDFLGVCSLSALLFSSRFLLWGRTPHSRQ